AIKQLVDNTEMYFIPMVNPDGYIYNQSTNPNGGGMWRKNRRANGGGIYGVDLNRNYSYEWGGSGASSDPNSEVYKGTSPMSEAEVLAMEWFTQQHEFVVAINNHTYGDQLLFPWGYADNVQSPDHDEYTAISAEMVAQNNYLNQQSALLYPAAGDSDDWGYGETTTKPRIYSMTSEIGGNSDGFWPSQNRIIPLGKENIYMNLTLARSALNFGTLTDLEPMLQTASGAISYSLQRLGWQDGSFTVSVEPLQGIASVGSSNNHSELSVAETVEDSIAFTLESGLATGDAIVYVLTLDNGIYVTRDTISKIYGSVVPLFANAGSPASDWDANNTWDLTTATFVSSPNSWTDSPNADYPNGSNRTLETVESIDLTDQTDAFLRFSAKWEIESGWDYAQISASTNGSSWTPLCGNYTVTGNENQDEGEPIYDGMQTTWVQEEISLADFVGESIYLRFRLVSDNYVREDGIYIDDLEVVGISDVTVSSTVELTENSFSVYPNPNNGEFTIILKKEAQISIYSSNGQLMLHTFLTEGKHTMDGDSWAQGLCIIIVETENGVLTERLVVR
ncbi:MAG: immune inhibitor A, partial [Flavobacteriales bacterium]|nr:immune inhibitor A [Flavobacteriales bacterium]